jgi:hypothetical protein
MVASKQTRIKMRRGFVAAPLTYKILMVRQFTDEDTKIITKGLIKALTPQKAKDLLPTPSTPRSKWMLRSVSQVGSFDVQILMYKGLEVALFFKRQTSIITPELEDPTPEGCIEDEDDIWVRMELFGKSPRQLVGSVAKELADKDLEISTLKMALESKDRVEEHYKVQGLRADAKVRDTLLEDALQQIKLLSGKLKRAETKPIRRKSNAKGK